MFEFLFPPSTRLHNAESEEEMVCHPPSCLRAVLRCESGSFPEVPGLFKPYISCHFLQFSSFVFSSFTSPPPPESAFSEMVDPFPISIELPLICTVKHHLVSPSVILPSCLCVQIRFDQMSHRSCRSGQCGGAGSSREGGGRSLCTPVVAR